MAYRRALLPSVLLFLLPAAVTGACGDGTGASTSGTTSSASTHGTTSSIGSGGSSASSVAGSGGSATGGAGGMGGSVVVTDGGPDACALGCSSDLHSVVDCQGNVVVTCTALEGCEASTGTCVDACLATAADKRSVGCEYYATDMDQLTEGLCFAAFVANTWDTPAHIVVDFAGATLPIEDFGFIVGSGSPPVFQPYDPAVGLPAGDVAVLFLAGTPSSDAPCPKPVAVATGAQIFNTSDIGNSFHITTDVPVVAYEINPYGGGSALVTGASLLLPTSVWDTNYVAVTAGPLGDFAPSMNVIASQDGTVVTMFPAAAVEGGGALPPGDAATVYTFTLDKGQQAQFTQSADLLGSVLKANKPIGFMAGQPCLEIPQGVSYCDHAEQMIPPIKALGSEYVGVMYRPRVAGDMGIWHLIGVVDGTALSYEPAPPPGAPPALAAGQVVEFITDQPFVVKSQSPAHPFMLFTYMSGSQWTQLSSTPKPGFGDPDFVIGVPPQQYRDEYVFFADPTYPETNLVVIRAPNESATFDDVTLDCAGALTDWQPIGDYQWTRLDLVPGLPPLNSCGTGRHEIHSASPFGVWVWGWSTPTAGGNGNVSYGYPGGMNVRAINEVAIEPSSQ